MEKKEKTLTEKGKNAVANYLEANGYEILDRDWTCKFGKLDIVAKDPIGTICFVEVKTRSGISSGLPSDTVDAKKQHKFEQIAMLYMVEKENIDNLCIRFDEISICVAKNNHALLRHNKSCFDGATENYKRRCQKLEIENAVLQNLVDRNEEVIANYEKLCKKYQKTLDALGVKLESERG